jgi:hypothetical protein
MKDYNYNDYEPDTPVDVDKPSAVTLKLIIIGFIIAIIALIIGGWYLVNFLASFITVNNLM